MIPLALSGLVSLSAWWAWNTQRLRYSPDFELYTQGGFGLYPSPIGRVIGASGEPAFVLSSIVAAGLVVYFTYEAAGSTWAALALVLSPVTLYLGHAGIDPIALAIYAAALAYRKPVLAVIGALAHLSLAPFALLELARTKHLTNLHRATIAAFLVPTLVLVLIATPYGGIVAAGIDPLSFLQGLGAGLLIGLPALAVSKLSPAGACGFLLGALECGAQQHLQARYLLPAVVLQLATGRLRAWPLKLPVRYAMLRQRRKAQVAATSLGATYYEAGGDSSMPRTLTIHRDAGNWHRIGELLAQDIQVAHFIRPLSSPIATPWLLQEAPHDRHLMLVPDDYSRRV